MKQGLWVTFGGLRSALTISPLGKENCATREDGQTTTQLCGWAQELCKSQSIYSPSYRPRLFDKCSKKAPGKKIKAPQPFTPIRKS
eukprot:m.710738 g.710738  ORF g.710738 m.710738 type:complete len:86 (-) comp58764_c0_seq10:115-372(-)